MSLATGEQESKTCAKNDELFKNIDKDITCDDEDERIRLVGVTFVWPYSGNSVLLTGSFFNWKNTIALNQLNATTTTPNVPLPSNTPLNDLKYNDTEKIFSSVLYLPPGKYEYKFIVDGGWFYDPRQSIVTDEIGNINNIVEIKPFN